MFRVLYLSSQNHNYTLRGMSVFEKEIRGLSMNFCWPVFDCRWKHQLVINSTALHHQSCLSSGHSPLSSLACNKNTNAKTFVTYFFSNSETNNLPVSLSLFQTGHAKQSPRHRGTNQFELRGIKE